MKVFLIILWLFLSVIPAPREEHVFSESFTYPNGSLPSHWWSEGNAGKIKDGRLFVDADTASFRVSTVWLDREFSGNLKIEFDVHIIASGDTANNINCFFLYSDPTGRPLRFTKNDREDADYGAYHKLNGYIITYLAGGNQSRARFRFRDNPGFNLIEEEYGYENKIGKTYHIAIVKESNRVQYWVDGKKMLDKVDDAFNSVHEKGFFGFRTFHTALWWDNLVISQLK